MPSSDETPPRTPRAGRVTALRSTKRDPDRIAVDLDGTFAFALPAQLVTDERIEVGNALDGKRINALLAAEESSRATEAALVFLAYRARSEKEVRDRLRRGGYAQEAIDHAISRLHEWRYLDDEDFARRWVENRTAHRPRGKRLLQQELRLKGIDNETAREVIADADVDETGAAEALARRRLPAYAGTIPRRSAVVSPRTWLAVDIATTSFASLSSVRWGKLTRVTSNRSYDALPITYHPSSAILTTRGKRRLGA
jgi:regulatory protein